MHMSMCCFLFNGQALQQPSGLLRGDILYFFGSFWPLEAHICKQLLCRKQEPIIFKAQSFDAVLLPVAKYKYADGRIRVQVEFQANQGGKPFDLFTEICYAAAQIDVFRPLCDNAQHIFCRVWISSARPVGSACGATSTVTLPIRIRYG